MTSILEQDLPTWGAAKTLNDLAECTVMWLEGKLSSQPGYYGSVDVDEGEAPGITSTLIALNRIGFLTNCSQAGLYPRVGADGGLWRQRAAVIGFCSTKTLETIMKLVCGTHYRVHEERMEIECGITITERKRLRDGSRSMVPAATAAMSERGWRRYTFSGGLQTTDEIAFQYSGCSKEAIASVASAHQIALYDPQIGPNTIWDHILSALSAMAARQNALNAMKLWEANPNCQHDIKDAPGGGIRCSKCGGWCCL